MNLFQAIVIGIIQGLTEFIPVSSTAHIRVLPALFGWKDPGAAFTAVIQWGTLIAVIIYFRHEIVHLSKAAFDDLFFQKILPDSGFQARLDDRRGHRAGRHLGISPT